MTENKNKNNNLNATSATKATPTSALEDWQPTFGLCPKCNSHNISINAMVILTSIPKQYQYKCFDCGHRWTDFGYKNNYSIEYEKKYGWICPICGSVYGPQVTECSRCASSFTPYVYYGNPPLNGITTQDWTTISISNSSTDATLGTIMATSETDNSKINCTFTSNVGYDKFQNSYKE